ncbi:MAG TPA: hypothetical protein VHU40_03110 [Polyangia bacterium]|nr:hypothetical protein [Polyangia bacterium]
MPIPRGRLRSRGTVAGLALLVSALPPLLARDARAGWGPVPVAPPAQEVPNEVPATPAPEVPAASAASETPAGMLSAADAALDANQLDRARVLYEALVKVYPTSTEAAGARRALKALTVRAIARPPSAPAPAATETPPPADDSKIVMRQEPYSLRTKERLRLTTWEKLDFGITAFLYGMSIGTSFAIAQDPSSPDVTGPLALGALAYTLGAVGYLNLANPDRGDLPLALAITSYVPTTVLLVANLATPDASTGHVELAVAGAGLLSIPLAVAVTRSVELDPGDTQLVRDAGFWGLALATTGTLAFGGETVDYGGFSSYQTPSTRKISGAALMGLFGGLGLGLLSASHSDISLERVRVTTWGGYGGALLGTLLGASGGGNDRDAWAGLTVGALVGLTVTFISTGSLDGIPAENAQVTAMNWAPSLLPVRDATGRTSATLGFSRALP